MYGKSKQIFKIFLGVTNKISQRDIPKVVSIQESFYWKRYFRYRRLNQMVQQNNTGTSIKNVQNSTLSTNGTVNNMNVCDCGCSYSTGSPEFIRLHVESQDEENDRLAAEQHLAEQKAQADYYANMPEPHSMMCGCVECN